jgi:nucleolar pre-ribosomal-associated protein 1
MKILHLVFRATEAGGSTTLTTRVAIVSWIQGQIADLGNNGEILGQLASIIYSTSDRQRVDLWSGASISYIVEQIAG